MKRALQATLTRILALVLTMTLVAQATGCLPLLFISGQSEQTQSTTVEAFAEQPQGQYNNLDFAQIEALLFAHEVQLDSLILNQLVENPAALDIKVPRPATLGNYSLQSAEEDNRFYNEILEALSGRHTVKFEQLTSQQQISYELITRVLKESLQWQEYYYYGEPLRPSMGAQAQIPLSLMDYSFRTIDDIEIYLELIEDIPRYFEQLLAHQQEKKQRKLLIADIAMKGTIEEARAYTGSAQSHLLVSYFNELLDTAATDPSSVSYNSPILASLTSEQRESYKKRNLAAVQNSLIPAYENLVSKLESDILPSCGEGVRLSDYPKGREFYALTLQGQGFAESPEDAVLALDTYISQQWQMLMANSDSLSVSLIPEQVVDAVGSEPQQFLAYIQERSQGEFPDAGDLRYSIKIASEESPNDFSMAYFLIPPVDNAQHNSMVYFPRNISDKVTFFGTMAHEGYPGHMYQTYEFSKTNPSDMSKLLGCTAYMEGWAMYAEYRSILYLDASQTQKDAYLAYTRFLYALQARIDLGVNYQGWTVGQTAEYLDAYFLGSAAQDLFDVALKQPVAYLPYGLGAIHFDELRQRAEQQQGASFDALAFHTQLLSAGPLPFDLLNSRFEAWLATGATATQ